MSGWSCLGRLLTEETQATRKAHALAHISPQVLEWISQQVYILVVLSSDRIVIVALSCLCALCSSVIYIV